jgi:hypothetical protein
MCDIAQKFEIENLLSHCSELLLSMLTMENVCLLYAWANDGRQLNIARRCRYYMARNDAEMDACMPRVTGYGDEKDQRSEDLVNSASSNVNN